SRASEENSTSGDGRVYTERSSSLMGYEGEKGGRLRSDVALLAGWTRDVLAARAGACNGRGGFIVKRMPPAAAARRDCRCRRGQVAPRRDKPDRPAKSGSRQ